MHTRGVRGLSGRRDAKEIAKLLEMLPGALSAARVANPCKMGLSWGLSLKFFVPQVFILSVAVERPQS